MKLDPILNNQACTPAQNWRIDQIVEILGQAGLLREPMFAVVRAAVGASRFSALLKTEISLIFIDSRAVMAGGLFVALKGARNDGHDYLQAVAEAGAVAAFVGFDCSAFAEGLIEKLGKQHGFIALPVTSPLQALQTLAKKYLASLPGVTKIGVTGSSGKTTTKDLLFAALSQGKRVFASKGNLNSVIGLPLAALALGPEHNVAVFEMAMSEVGEMATLADIVLPDLAIITNIGLAHIGNIGSQEAIAYEKKQIFSKFTGSQTAFIPQTDSWAFFLADGIKGQAIRYGEASLAGYEGHDQWAYGQILRWKGQTIHLRLPGAHNRLDAIAAIWVADSLGLSPRQIREGLETFNPGFGRSEILQGGVTLVQDCYNANPDSMKASIQSFNEMSAGTGSRVMILGDMLELGPDSRQRHAEIGDIAALSGSDVVLFCGNEMKAAYLAATEVESTGRADRSHLLHVAWFETRDQLSQAISDYVDAGDLVLLKGSRGMEMEKLSPILLNLKPTSPDQLADAEEEALDPELLAKYLVADDDTESSTP